MAKVKIVESSSEFLAVVEKSGLLSGDDLEAARKVCGATEDPKVAARKLLSDGLLTQWQASQLLAGFAGLVMGKYELMDALGKGDFGRIYLAEHVTMGEKVALHTLSTKGITDSAAVERFLSDLNAATKFDHRNTIRVLEVTSDQDRHFVATEYVDGTDLANRVEKEGPINANEAIELIGQAADGLAYIHAQGLLHRDLKPASLVVDKSGAVRIGDLAIGHLRFSDSANSESSSQISFATLAYTSPEQARGKEVDSRSDIYSLGGILYYILTGRAPFSATTDEERETIKSTKRPVPILTFNANVPPALAELVDRMTAMRAADRPGSMQEVADSLRAFSPKAPSAEAPSEEEPLEELAVEPESESMFAFTEEELQPADAGDKTDAGDKADADDKEKESAAEPQPIAEAAAEETAAKPLGKPSSEEPAQQEAAQPAAEKISIVIPDAAAEKSAPLPADFKIHRKKTVKVPVPDGSEPGELTPALEALSKKRRARMILLGSSIGAMLLVVIFSVVAMMLSSDDAPAVATQDASAATGAGESAGATAQGGNAAPAFDPNDPNDPENIPDPELMNLATASAAPPAGATPPGAAVPAEQPVTATQPAAPAAPPANSAAPTSVAAATPASPMAVAPPPAAAQPAATTAPAAAPTTAQPPPTDVAATPMPTATPAPATPTPETPAPTATAAVTPTEPPATPMPTETTPMPATAAVAATPVPEPKPEPAKPAPAPAKPAKPAKPKKTFELATMVDLPQLPSGEGSAPPEPPAKVLGRINLNENDACFLALIGGSEATKGKAEFYIRNAQGGTAPRDWEFVVRDPTNTETVIATLGLSGSDLKFEWTEPGLKSSLSPFLRNCAVKVTAGQEKPHIFSLRTPLQEAPATLATLEKTPLTLKYAVDAIPDTLALRFEPKIDGLKYVFESLGNADPTKGDQWIHLAEKKEDAPLTLKMEASATAKGIQVLLTPYVALPGDKPQRLTPALRKKLSVNDLQQQKLLAQSQLEQLKKAPKEQASKLQNEVLQRTQLLTNLDQAIARLQKLDEVMTALSTAQLQIRVYFDAGESQIDLVRTIGAPAG